MKTKTETIEKITIPAGTYILGDPCYVIRDEDWMPLLEDCDYFRWPVGKIGGHQVIALGTKYGDGCYHDQSGNPYGVDAGLIGLVPMAYGGKKSHGNREVTFTEPAECWDEDGVLHFGDIVIDTANFTEDEAEDEGEE
jgi:hypothetical protein